MSMRHCKTDMPTQFDTSTCAMCIKVFSNISLSYTTRYCFSSQASDTRWQCAGARHIIDDCSPWWHITKKFFNQSDCQNISGNVVSFFIDATNPIRISIKHNPQNSSYFLYFSSELSIIVCVRRVSGMCRESTVCMIIEKQKCHRQLASKMHKKLFFVGTRCPSGTVHNNTYMMLDISRI